MKGKMVAAHEAVGKTVASVRLTYVQGAWGKEPATRMNFTDGTWTRFVHPAEDE